jgi:hypothetical protein
MFLVASRLFDQAGSSISAPSLYRNDSVDGLPARCNVLLILAVAAATGPSAFLLRNGHRLLT